MTPEPFVALNARTVLLVRDDIDTDQIIPARFLTTTTRDGLGAHLFADWRYDASRTPRADFPLNAAGAAGSRILLAGRNFGCGSSREHAPWALMDWGFRAVIATSFADIFRSNAHKNGLLTVALDAKAHADLKRLLESSGGATVTIDLANQFVAAGDGFRASFEIEPFTKQCLIDGVDELGSLLAASGEIEAFERRHPLPPVAEALARGVPA